MKKSIFHSILISIILYGCSSSPKIKFTEYEWAVSNDSKNIFLDYHRAKDSIYSVIIFTSVFKKDLIKVETCDSIIFNDIINSNSSTGKAKSIRINNNFDIKITDLSLNYSFKLKKEYNTKYKYIYIQRKRYEGNKYVITYSNDLRPFF